MSSSDCRGAPRSPTGPVSPTVPSTGKPHLSGPGPPAPGVLLPPPNTELPGVKDPVALAPLTQTEGRYVKADGKGCRRLLRSLEEGITHAVRIPAADPTPASRLPQRNAVATLLGRIGNLRPRRRAGLEPAMILTLGHPARVPGIPSTRPVCHEAGTCCVGGRTMSGPQNQCWLCDTRFGATAFGLREATEATGP